MDFIWIRLTALLFFLVAQNIAHVAEDRPPRPFQCPEWLLRWRVFTDHDWPGFARPPRCYVSVAAMPLHTSTTCEPLPLMAGARHAANFDNFTHNQGLMRLPIRMNAATVDKIVDIFSSRFQRVQQPRLSKLLNLKTRQRVAHLRPRRIPDSRESALFSVASVSMRCGRLVGRC